VLAASAVSLGVALTAVSFAQARPAQADNPLEDASRAAEQVPFSGQLALTWWDDGGMHTTHAAVHSGEGEVQIAGPSVLVATTSRRYVVSAGGWDLLSPGDPSELGPYPALSKKYHVTEAPGPELAGRPTIQVDIGAAARPAERLYLDQATRLLVRREEWDAAGEPVRVVSFVSLHIGDSTTMPKPGHTVDERARRLGAGSLPAPYVDPEYLGQGYQRVGVLQAFDGIQVVYSDGLHGLSVFERLGSLSRHLPAGEPVRVGSAAGARYVWAGGQVVMWQERGFSYVAVSDAPAAEVLAALDDLPAAHGGTPWQRLRHACRRVVQAVSGIW
jgi:hypothetical protein